ncbi:hypothetical protein GCM10029963_72830 [Micromonospora andamanensis]|uniref:hypothetical protein n=1 Tax=Micromonospora andamanensis TaxID=1287068 RepID=UPI001A512F4C|nr:hypothetical protein Vwe01_30460 [Micromonospora andamanensis]
MASRTGNRICGPCAGTDNDHACHLCGSAGDLYANRSCVRCILTGRLQTLIPDEAPHRHVLQPLIDALVATPQPRSMIKWLSHSPVPRLLSDLAQRPEAISRTLRPFIQWAWQRHLVADVVVPFRPARGRTPWRFSAFCYAPGWADRPCSPGNRGRSTMAVLPTVQRVAAWSRW